MLKNDFDELEIGDWYFINGESHIGIRLGEDEHKEFCILPIQNEKNPKEIIGTHWNWNGNKENPTLNPSILHWGNGRDQPATWHGYLRDGKLITA